MKAFAPACLAVVWVLSGCGKSPGRALSDSAKNVPPAENHHSSMAAPQFTDSDALIREKGRAVVQETFSLLSSNLLAALAAGGPSNAIPFCSIQALPLTESVSKNYKVEVRRVSHRVRNPMNTPTSEEAAVLDQFATQLSRGQSPSPIVKRGANAAFFYAPIVINNPLCLTCHGEPGKNIAPETAKLLSRLYPNDQATGFKMNDLRGMWVVKIQSEGSGQ